jgi:hypothetical protein
MHTTASRLLYGVNSQLVKKSVITLRTLGEDRNTIIHGLLCANQNGELSFRGRGRNVLATLDELRTLTKRCHEAALEFNTHIQYPLLNFYTEIIGKKSTSASLETAVQNMLGTSVPLLKSTSKLRQSTLEAREAETTLRASQRKADESREQLV